MYNYVMLRRALHEQLDNALDRLQYLDPEDGIVDLIIKSTHSDLTDKTTVHEVTSELVQLVDETWILEEVTAIKTTYDHV